jgi:hypothetical protein
MRFSHLGEAIAFYEGEQPAPMRAPGDLFSDDATVLVVAPDPADDQVLRYQDVQAGELIANGPVLFLHVDPVVRHVEQRLAGK